MTDIEKAKQELREMYCGAIELEAERQKEIRARFEIRIRELENSHKCLTDFIDTLSIELERRSARNEPTLEEILEWVRKHG